MTDVDVLIIGGGAMGLSTAWQLARRGRRVRLLEQFQPGHHMGASHGATRNFNTSYTQPDLVAMLHESRALWGELGLDSGRQILDLVGLVNHGPGAASPEVHGAISASGEPAELLSTQDAGERWPGIRFDTEVLHLPRAGRVRAADALTSMAELAAASGAELSWGMRAVNVVEQAEHVVVEAHSWGEEAEHRGHARETITAKVVVSAVNAWTRTLLGGAVELPRLRVTQEAPVHFREFNGYVDWPSFNHLPALGRPGYEGWLSPVYGMLTPGEGIKAGWHGVGPVVDPDSRDFLPVSAQLDGIRQYARDWLPGVDADSADPISCTYTTTDDARFVIDRVGRIVVLAGFAGEGFKFVPSIGRLGADLAENGAGAAPELFSISRPRSLAPQPLR
ncbi:FAD-dependent oxidoreductase [Pseudoclavibacter sp. RFBI5]|uniref:FAD-dependent oxidoreductase n=1 Tax=Pseudoclavibacter sp. RFBI5 TaxID=2080578 RepID=UPI000CE7E098|nr:FAD-dependent oxidoreductase [Pseudoclavibacter sp. RFBI5]PPG01781.1 FAD-dependent oxidoreductase [Pseudoclavibacter sp. RFBI5]